MKEAASPGSIYRRSKNPDSAEAASDPEATIMAYLKSRYNYLKTQIDSNDKIIDKEDHKKKLLSTINIIKRLSRSLMEVWSQNQVEDFYREEFIQRVCALPLGKMIDCFKKQILAHTQKSSPYYKVQNQATLRQQALKNLQDRLEAVEDKESLTDSELAKICKQLAELRLRTLLALEGISEWRMEMKRIGPSPNVMDGYRPFVINGQSFIETIRNDTDFLKKSFLTHFISFTNESDPLLLSPYKLLINSQNSFMEKHDCIVNLFNLNFDMAFRLNQAQKVLLKENISVLCPPIKGVKGENVRQIYKEVFSEEKEDTSHQTSQHESIVVRQDLDQKSRKAASFTTRTPKHEPTQSRERKFKQLEDKYLNQPFKRKRSIEQQGNDESLNRDHILPRNKRQSEDSSYRPEQRRVHTQHLEHIEPRFVRGQSYQNHTNSSQLVEAKSNQYSPQYKKEPSKANSKILLRPIEVPMKSKIGIQTPIASAGGELMEETIEHQRRDPKKYEDSSRMTSKRRTSQTKGNEPKAQSQRKIRQGKDEAYQGHSESEDESREYRSNSRKQSPLRQTEDQSKSYRKIPKQYVQQPSSSTRKDKRIPPPSLVHSEEDSGEQGSSVAQSQIAGRKSIKRKVYGQASPENVDLKKYRVIRKQQKPKEKQLKSKGQINQNRNEVESSSESEEIQHRKYNKNNRRTGLQNKEEPLKTKHPRRTQKFSGNKEQEQTQKIQQSNKDEKQRAHNRNQISKQRPQHSSKIKKQKRKKQSVSESQQEQEQQSNNSRNKYKKVQKRSSKSPEEQQSQKKVKSKKEQIQNLQSKAKYSPEGPKTSKNRPNQFESSQQSSANQQIKNKSHKQAQKASVEAYRIVPSKPSKNKKQTNKQNREQSLNDSQQQGLTRSEDELQQQKSQKNKKNKTQSPRKIKGTKDVASEQKEDSSSEEQSQKSLKKQLKYQEPSKSRRKAEDEKIKIQQKNSIQKKRSTPQIPSQDYKKLNASQRKDNLDYQRKNIERKKQGAKNVDKSEQSPSEKENIFVQNESKSSGKSELSESNQDQHHEKSNLQKKKGKPEYQKREDQKNKNPSRLKSQSPNRNRSQIKRRFENQSIQNDQQRISLGPKPTERAEQKEQPKMRQNKSEPYEELKSKKIERSIQSQMSGDPQDNSPVAKYTSSVFPSQNNSETPNQQDYQESRGDYAKSKQKGSPDKNQSRRSQLKKVDEQPRPKETKHKTPIPNQSTKKTNPSAKQQLSKDPPQKSEEGSQQQSSSSDESDLEGLNKNNYDPLAPSRQRRLKNNSKLSNPSLNQYQANRQKGVQSIAKKSVQNDARNSSNVTPSRKNADGTQKPKDEQFYSRKPNETPMSNPKSKQSSKRLEQKQNQQHNQDSLNKGGPKKLQIRVKEPKIPKKDFQAYLESFINDDYLNLLCQSKSSLDILTNTHFNIVEVTVNNEPTALAICCKNRKSGSIRIKHFFFKNDNYLHDLLRVCSNYIFTKDPCVELCVEIYEDKESAQYPKLVKGLNGVGYYLNNSVFLPKSKRTVLSFLLKRTKPFPEQNYFDYYCQGLELMCSMLTLKSNNPKDFDSDQIDPFTAENFTSHFMSHQLLKCLPQEVCKQFKTGEKNKQIFGNEQLLSSSPGELKDVTKHDKGITMKAANASLTNEGFDTYETARPLDGIFLSRLKIQSSIDFSFIVDNSYMLFNVPENLGKFYAFGETKLLFLNTKITNCYFVLMKDRTKKLQAKSLEIIISNHMEEIKSGEKLQKLAKVGIHFLHKQLYGKVHELDPSYKIYGNMEIGVVWRDYLEGGIIHQPDLSGYTLFDEMTVAGVFYQHKNGYSPVVQTLLEKADMLFL